jgi:hypothetical protein
MKTNTCQYIKNLSVCCIFGPGFKLGKSVYWAARDAGGNSVWGVQFTSTPEQMCDRLT